MEALGKAGCAAATLGLGLFFALPSSAQMSEALSPQAEAEKNCVTCQGVILDSHRDPRCSGFFLKLYDKPSVNFTIGFGYNDLSRQDGSLGEGNYALLQVKELVDRLLAPCTPKQKGVTELCGFSPTVVSKDRPLTLSKEITVLSRKRVVNIQVIDSIPKADRSQLEESRNAERMFFESVPVSKAVLYLGHSRDGGGPDFYPAKRVKTAKGEQVDYAWYHTNHPGLTSLLKTFRDSGEQQPLLYGSYSCDSKKHFLDRLKKVAPRSGFILADNLVDPSDSFDAMTHSLDSLLSVRCDGAFQGVSDNHFGTYRLFSQFKKDPKARALFQGVYDRLGYEMVLSMNREELVGYLKAKAAQKVSDVDLQKAPHTLLLHQYLISLFNSELHDEMEAFRNAYVLSRLAQKTDTISPELGKLAEITYQQFKQSDLVKLSSAAIILESGRKGSLQVSAEELGALREQALKDWKRASDTLNYLKRVYSGEKKTRFKSAELRIQQIEEQLAVLHSELTQ